MRRNPNSINKSFTEVYADLREFIDLSHRDGSIKKEVLANIESYIIKDPHLSDTLVKLIEGGKSLFLLTNSDWTYTNEVMNFLLGQGSDDFPKWEDYFDFIFVNFEAKARQAYISSTFNDGYASRSSSILSPLASIWTIWCTGILVPFIQASP